MYHRQRCIIKLGDTLYAASISRVISLGTGNMGHTNRKNSVKPLIAVAQFGHVALAERKLLIEANLSPLSHSSLDCSVSNGNDRIFFGGWGVGNTGSEHSLPQLLLSTSASGQTSITAPQKNPSSFNETN